MEADTGIYLSSIRVGVSNFKEDRPIQRNLLPPLPRLSEEEELNLALENAKIEIKKIKDNLLNNLAAGEVIDIEKLKADFEKAEADIHDKKENVLQRFCEKADTICISNALSDHSVRKCDMVISRMNSRDERAFSCFKIQNSDSSELTFKNFVKNTNTESNTSVDPRFDDVEKLKCILCPTRKQAPTLNRYNTKSKAQITKPITGSTISKVQQMPSDDRKQILITIQRKMLPASSSLTTLSVPFKMKKAVLHEPSEKLLPKQDGRYNFALVRFDELTLDAAINSIPPKISPVAPNASAAPSFDNGVSRDQMMKLGPSNLSMDYELSALQNLFPSSDVQLLSLSSKIVVQDGHVIRNSEEFVRFHRKHSRIWHCIENLLAQITALMKDFSVPIAFIDGGRLAETSRYFELGPRPTIKDLLICVINSDEVGKIIQMPGRRYLASDGPDIAATYIQKIWRGYYLEKLYQEEKTQKIMTGFKAVRWIMNLKLHYIRVHLKIKNKEYLKNYRMRMNSFKENWSTIKTSPRIIVHIPSLGYSVKTRKNLLDIETRQNSQMGRICDIHDPNVEVIYISPTNIDEKMNDYYKGLIHTMCSVSGQEYSDASSRLKILTPESLGRFWPHNLCLSSSMKYSDHLIRKVQKLTKGREAYIVPGLMHKDDMYIADKLDLPVLGCEPETCAIYSLKSGLHRILEKAGVDRPPGEYSVRNKQQFYELLAKLVTQNLHIKRWLFKIDDSFDGRGTAYCDITPYLENYDVAVKEAERYGSKWKIEQWAQETTRKKIFYQLADILKQHATPVDNTLFASWPDFFTVFLKEGGVIEAHPPSDDVNGITANVLIEPDGNIQILSIADQIHAASPYRCWGHTLPQTSVETEVIKERINSIVEVCKSRHIVGYVSLDFVSFINAKTNAKELWAVGLQIGYSNTQALFQAMSSITDATPDINNNRLEVESHLKPRKRPIYVPRDKRNDPAVREKSTEIQKRVIVVSPNVYHTNLNTIGYHVLFALCQSHGITYNDKTKIGTSFGLVGATKRDIMGMLTIGVDLRQAVSMFIDNLKLIHEEISTPSMLGSNNFPDAIVRLESILERIRLQEQEKHLVYPTPDERCRRRTKSACGTPGLCGFDGSRPMSAGDHKENFDSDFLLEDVKKELKINAKRRSVR